MKRLLKIVPAALALMGFLPVVSAATQLGEYFSISGFGTLGAVQTDSDEGKFGKDRQIDGADKTASFNVDSNFGLQLVGNATPWLAGTVQMLAAMRDKNKHLDPAVEWAFITVKPVDGLTLRGGRMAAPIFAISDSRNVGYANTWVRAPNEVYALNVFTNMNGLDATYRKTLGPVSVSVTGFGGKSQFYFAGGNVKNKVKDIQGLTLALESEWATFRLGQAKATVVSPFSPLPDPYKFTSLGVVVDRDDLIVQAEYVTRASEVLPAIVDARGWYVMLGYRFGAVTPYAIASKTALKNGPNRGGISGQQTTTAVGARWDAFKSAALKFQVERVDTDNSKGISFATPTFVPGPGPQPFNRPVTQAVTALSLTVDFAF